MKCLGLVDELNFQSRDDFFELSNIYENLLKGMSRITLAKLIGYKSKNPIEYLESELYYTGRINMHSGIVVRLCEAIGVKISVPPLNSGIPSTPAMK